MFSVSLECPAVSKPPIDQRFDDDLARIVPLPDDEAAICIAVILAAHGRQFPQLRGEGVGRHQTDEARRIFASRLLEHLRRGRMGLFRSVTDRPLMMETGGHKPHK